MIIGNTAEVSSAATDKTKHKVHKTHVTPIVLIILYAKGIVNKSKKQI